MKKLLLIACLLTSTPAFADSAAFSNGRYVPPWQRSAATTDQATNAPGAPNQGGQPGERGGPPGAGRGQNLAEMKSRIEQHINQRIAEMQQRLSCVQSANTPDALRACGPGERGGERGEGERGGPGGGRFGQNGGGFGPQGGDQMAQGGPPPGPPPQQRQ